MILLNPQHRTHTQPDGRSEEIMRRTIEFFEARGKERLKADDHAREWYGEFLDFVREERIFATLLTPAADSTGDGRWDTSRLCEFAEILGFYGLPYWYTWQVTILGLGPIWMSDNAEARARAAQLLEDGAIFAFGLSEKEHGADLYSTDMELVPQGDGTYLARGDKYYIGNGNKAAMVSVFGKDTVTGEYVFFAVDSQHERYELVKNVVASQNFVSEFRLNDYPITEADILERGDEAWNAALNTVNIGKYNLGWGSIGICTHALYEAMNHAANRHLYGMAVTDFPHVRRMFTDAYARICAMKLVATRANDYMRSASKDDRRYLLFNPVVKMKVTTQGEQAIHLLWDVLAAKAFEKDMYFESAARDISALPRLEGTVHVNIALIVKFMASYLFGDAELPEVGRRDDAANDDFLFDQGPTKGLSSIVFPDWETAFRRSPAANVAVFREQVAVLKELLATATPDEAQRKDIDFLMAIGSLFTLVVYGQLVLEGAERESVGDDLVDEIFGVLVADFSAAAVELHGKPSATGAQGALCLAMVRKPAADQARYDRVWTDVLGLEGAYELSWDGAAVTA
jgi:acyl-CoA dehydrogenase